MWLLGWLQYGPKRACVVFSIQFVCCLLQKDAMPNKHLVGGFNPFENISQNGNLPQVGVNIKKYLKPPPRTQTCHPRTKVKPFALEKKGNGLQGESKLMLKNRAGNSQGFSTSLCLV